MPKPNKYLEQMTAQERLDLGMSYFEEGRFDKAIKTWSNIHRDDNPETYAAAQFNLGNAYEDQGNLDKAIAAYSNIHRDDNPETYAKAQLNLGVAYEDQGKLDNAITAYSNIHRDDNPETYAKAQRNLGITYYTRGKLDNAITAWSNIHRDDNPETYAKAQLNLGNAYEDQGKLDNAITAYSNIHRDDNPETYAAAQFNLGITYYTRGNLDKAIAAYSNIHRDDNPETYAKAQLNLGNAYEDRGKLDKAIAAWSNIHRDDNPETYAKAQLNLGVAYKDQGNLDKAIAAYSNIHRDDNPETYAKAQLNLGITYYTRGKLDNAITAWSNIHRDDNPETYAKAQLNLGITYYTRGKLDKAIAAWSNIHRDDNPETYAKAQLTLGVAYKDQGNLDKAKEAYRNAREFFYYEGERGYRIHECPPEVIKKLRNIAKSTDKVLKSLQIIPKFESKVAHYSRPSTAFSLFGDEKNDKEPSHFRLSTIRGVNDPTEGLVLRDYWEQQGISETIHTNDTATFVSCFTFNHDSLNQFRLYGKEDGREATGVSLVFKKEFFSEESGALNHIVGASPDPSNKSRENEPDEPGKPENDNKKLLIDKSTLYRCIYLDPETGYWTLAQRDKSTFYREHNEDADAKEKWGKYYESISTKEEDVETHLFNKENNDDNSVSSILKSIFTEDHLYNKCNKDEKQKILEAIRFILLPLQYLVKHIAFQEEQECRIMYITQFRDEKIHSNREEQKMYVEYEEPVLPHIDKIWLSPGAAKDQDFFRILLDKEDNDNKVRISQNPFRNKE